MGIPKISGQKLNELYATIKPVIRYAEVRCGGRTKLERHDQGDPYYIKDVDLRNVAYTWDPKPTERASGLVEYDNITTYHTYGYHGFFKPSIAEVLAQIPEDKLEETVAFTTEYYGMSGEHHAGVTTLYRRKSLEEINSEIDHLKQEKSKLEKIVGE